MLLLEFYEEKTIEVCSSNSTSGDNCCDYWRSSIQVIMCPAGDKSAEPYYIYRLKKVPACQMAYCVGSGRLCPARSAWNDVTKTCAGQSLPVTH